MSSTQIRLPVLLAIAALFVIIAGLRAAADLVEPLLLAVFFSIVCAPAVSLLVRRGWPEWAAVIVVMVLLLAALLFAAIGIGASINGFLEQLPAYQKALGERVGGLIGLIRELGIDVDQQALRQQLDPGLVMGMAGKLVGRFGSALGNVLLILLTVTFILLEAARFPAKLQHAMGDANRSLAVFERFSEGVKQYLAIKSMLSLATGALVALMLWLLDVDYPVLWGALAFLFNYIPNIGSFLAAIPACLLAFVIHGPGVAAAAGFGYVLINMVIGNGLEPRLMGRSLGLSTLVVFLSLVLWGWVMGPVGMVLSVPLTMILRIALDSSEETRWLAVLLGPEVDSRDQSSVADGPSSGA